MTVDPHTLVRAGSVYLVAAVTVLVYLRRRPSARAFGAATLAAFWNLPVLLAINVAAPSVGWWTFDADGGLWLGVPIDLLLAWVWIWGIVPVLACPRLRLPVVVLGALAVDLVLMPLAAPVVRLGPGWLIGEAVALTLGFLPGQLLARWTLQRDQLVRRALLQMLTFGGLLLFVLPAAAIDGSGGGWINPLDRPLWQLSLLAQLIAIPGVIGLSAVQEFVTRGRGTPVPFDPPRRLVSSGVYAYVRSPMQLSATLMLAIGALALGNLWICAAAIVAHIYSMGLAGWDEDVDLRRRFGHDWDGYRAAVPAWIPRWRPFVREGQLPSRLYVSETCGMCGEVGQWFTARAARGMVILAAESHPSASLTRITYEAGDGFVREVGIAAVARALEHVHFGWACLAFALRLPLIRTGVQLLVDASGGQPRRVACAAQAPSPGRPQSTNRQPRTDLSAL